MCSFFWHHFFLVVLMCIVCACVSRCLTIRLCKSWCSTITQQVEDIFSMSIPMKPMQTNNLALVLHLHNHVLHSCACFTPNIYRKYIVFNIFSTTPTPNACMVCWWWSRSQNRSNPLLWVWIQCLYWFWSNTCRASVLDHQVSICAIIA